MNYFPLFADLTGRPVLVVGGGSVAARKVGLLLKANAQVRIVARQLNEELSELERQNKVLWIAKEFNAEQMRTVMLVIAATNDEVLNHRIFYLAESQHKLVNVVDDQLVVESKGIYSIENYLTSRRLIVIRFKLRFRVVERRRY